MNIIYIFFILFLIYLENNSNLAANGEKTKLVEINSDWFETREYNYLKNKNPKERFSFKNIIGKYLKTKINKNYYSISRNLARYSPEIEIIKNNIVDKLFNYLPKQVFKYFLTILN